MLIEAALAAAALFALSKRTAAPPASRPWPKKIIKQQTKDRLRLQRQQAQTRIDGGATSAPTVTATSRPAATISTPPTTAPAASFRTGGGSASVRVSLGYGPTVLAEVGNLGYGQAPDFAPPIASALNRSACDALARQIARPAHNLDQAQRRRHAIDQYRAGGCCGSRPPRATDSRFLRNAC